MGRMILLFAPFTVLVLAHSVDVVVDRNDLVAFAQLAFSGAMASCGIVRGGGYVPAPRCPAGGGVFDASHRPPATAVRRGGAVSAPKPAIGTAHPGSGSVRGARRRGPAPPRVSVEEAFVVTVVGGFIAYIAANIDEIKEKQAVATAAAEETQRKGVEAAKAAQKAGAAEAQKAVERGRKEAEDARKRQDRNAGRR